jgi:hypothetical protein
MSNNFTCSITTNMIKKEQFKVILKFHLIIYYDKASICIVTL